MTRSSLRALLLVLLALPTTSVVRASLADEAERPVAAEAVEPVTVLLVRHAEKAADDPRDPGLTESGEERARAFARLAGSAGVTHLFATPYRRTRATLAPLARLTGLEVADVSAADAAEVAARLRELAPGSIAVVAGHSNTTPQLVRALGAEPSGLVDGPYGEMIPEHAYDRLFVVTFAAPGTQGEPRAPGLLELRYGAESAPPDGR